jgi:hypothetical protein
MRLRLAFVTIKQYRFELSFAALATALAIALGLIIHLRLDGLPVSRECLEQVRASIDGSGIADGCFALVQAGSGILGDTYMNAGGVLQVSIMGLLPFVLGIFGGIPVIARELEDGTAQTAWWLHGSRNRWLAERLAPMLLMLGLAVILAAIVATPVADDWGRWYGGERSRLVGTYGPPVVIRAFGAFGVGLAAGAFIGRTFPAFVGSVAVLLIVMVVSMQARDAWLGTLPLTPLWERSAVTGQWESVGGVPKAVAWGGPAGEILSRAEARQRATDAGIPPPQPDDPYDTAAEGWLQANGYAEITLGVSDEAAAGWAGIDAGIFAVIGTIGFATAFSVVSRRRPTR